MSIGPKYEAYQNTKRANAEIKAWLAHIGKAGRGSDVLSLSIAHATVKLCVAGQYTTGGQNYWDSPKAFNDLLLKHIHENFAEISVAITERMNAAEEAAKLATKEELEAALSDLTAA